MVHFFMVFDMAQRALIIGVVSSIALHMVVLAIPFSLKKSQSLVTDFQEIRLSLKPQTGLKAISPDIKKVKKKKSNIPQSYKKNPVIHKKKFLNKPASIKKTKKTEKVELKKVPRPVVKSSFEKKIEKTTTKNAVSVSEKKIEPPGTTDVTTKNSFTSNESSANPGKKDDSYNSQISEKALLSKREITDTEEKSPDETDIYRGDFGGNNGPKFLKKVIPRYPRLARKLGKEGRVVLRLFITKEGKLERVEVIEDDGYGFAREAVKAIKESTFMPAVRKGIPVDSEAVLTVRFRLKD